MLVDRVEGLYEGEDCGNQWYGRDSVRKGRLVDRMGGYDGGTVRVGDMDVSVGGREGWLTGWADMMVGL